MPRLDLSPLADRDVREIWEYTAETWSERQANAYVDDLFDEPVEMRTRRNPPPRLHV